MDTLAANAGPYEHPSQVRLKSPQRMQPIEITPIGSPWPSCGYAESALLAVSEDQLEERLSAKLLHGVEEGLGAWTAIGLRLPSGEMVELVHHRGRPGERAFLVRTVATASPQAVLDELLVCLHLPQIAVIWQAGNVPT